MSSVVDYTKRETSILFGDGAGAVLVEPSKNEFGWEDEYLRSDGIGAEWLMVKGGGSMYPMTQEALDSGWHYITQDGKTVFKAAVSEMASATEEIVNRNNINPEDIKFLMPHQANKRIIDAAAVAVAAGVNLGLEVADIAHLANAACECIMSDTQNFTLTSDDLANRLGEVAWSLQISQR